MAAKAQAQAPTPNTHTQHLPKGSVTVTGNGAPATVSPAQALTAWAQAQPQAYAKATQALAKAGYTPERTAHALAVMALRHQGKHAWSVCGQAVGMGTQGKARSGASGARSLYNAAQGKAGQPGSVATAAAPAVSRARTGQQQGAGKQQGKAS